MQLWNEKLNILYNLPKHSINLEFVSYIFITISKLQICLVILKFCLDPPPDFHFSYPLINSIELCCSIFCSKNMKQKLVNNSSKLNSGFGLCEVRIRKCKRVVTILVSPEIDELQIFLCMEMIKNIHILLESSIFYAQLKNFII